MAESSLYGSPPEDAGASTANRYRFQYCCAASRLLAAVAEDVRCEIICEWHEDYLVITNGHLEAVCVKHREDNRPAWTAASISGPDGNLRHLFETFQRANGQIDCCFETNRANQLKDLKSTDSKVQAAAKNKLAHCLAISRDELDPFLARLTFGAPVPNRRDIENTYADRYAVPAMDRLGISGLAASRAMSIARDLIADASAERLDLQASAAVLAASPHKRTQVIATQVLARRRVTDNDLADALRYAASHRVPSLKVTEGEAPPETTMTKKLVDGGLGRSTIETAQRRRCFWFSHVAQYRDISSRQAELASLKEWVQDQANAAEATALETAGESYGRTMHDELITRLRDPALLPAGTRAEDGDPALLSGAAYQLTDDCSVWFAARTELHSDD